MCIYTIYTYCVHVFRLVYACVCSPGFQVVGGESSGRMDLGTIISSITPGGPADVNGSLKPGRLAFGYTLPLKCLDVFFSFVECCDDVSLLTQFQFYVLPACCVPLVTVFMLMQVIA